MKLNARKDDFVIELYKEFSNQNIPLKCVNVKYIVQNDTHEFHFRNTDIEYDLGDEFFNAVHNTIKKFTDDKFSVYDTLKMSWDSDYKRLSVDILVEFGIDELLKKKAEECHNMLDDNHSKYRHISIDTPCSVSDMEGFLHIVSHEGHWHDATVYGKDGKIVIEYSTDEK